MTHKVGTCRDVANIDCHFGPFDIEVGIHGGYVQSELPSQALCKPILITHKGKLLISIIVSYIVQANIDTQSRLVRAMTSVSPHFKLDASNIGFQTPIMSPVQAVIPLIMRASISRSLRMLTPVACYQHWTPDIRQRCWQRPMLSLPAHLCCPAHRIHHDSPSEVGHSPQRSRI